MGKSDGAVRGATKIIDAGDPKQRWNVAIVSEGYQAGEMGRFAVDAQQLADTLLAAAPFDRLKKAINVFRVDVTSKESGAKDPTKCGGTGAKPKTYFDAAFCNNGIRRLLMANNPDYAAAYFHCGQTLERMGQLDEARATYQQGIDVTPASAIFIRVASCRAL